MRSLRIALALLLALLPSWIKVPLYRRLFDYRIGKGVRIGWSPFVGIKRCQIGDGVRIGAFNLFYQVDELDIGAHTQIGFLNLFRGGQRIRIGAYCTILRRNVCNAILDPDFITPAESILELGPGVVITSSHWIDFSDRIDIGAHTIIGGRNSSFWTHNRQRGHPITVGAHCYLGSEIRVAPGVVIPPVCIVALGSVLMGEYQGGALLAGNPARELRALSERDLFLVFYRTRKDIPDELAQAYIPEDLLEVITNPARQPARSR